MKPDASRVPAPPGATLAGMLAVGATYVSFLLHAQFGFLALVQARVGAGEVEPVLAAMGVAGFIASLALGSLLRRLPARGAVLAGLAGCALAPVAALGCRTPTAFAAAAAFIGAATGVLTVSLASRLRDLIPGPQLGLKVGWATGVAYLVANLPPVFHGGPVIQSVLPAACCALALAAVAWTGRRDVGTCAPTSAEPSDAAPDALGPSDSRALGFATLVASFLALVWLDSAAFRIVQETDTLKGLTWGPGARTLGQGMTHLVAAVVAGHLLDRGRLRSLLVATFALFSLAFALLSAGRIPAAVAGPLYAVGISTYSTALVLAPSLGPDGPGLVPRRWRAATLYAVAGWIGSALGVGMARDLHRIPAVFTAAAGIVLLGGAALARARGLRPVLRAFGPVVALAAAGAVPVLLPARVPDARASPEQRGRRTYVAEGCIACHSQFVRPGADEASWGPRRVDHMKESPPLVGARRIGPDLLDVGNRRSAAWQQLHLREPAILAPGSRMPSYAHLFAPGDTRGDDLVAYLASLGRLTLGARAQAVRVAPLPASSDRGDVETGRRLFGATCAACHGAQGRGDGPLAVALQSPFLDLHLPGLPRVERVTGEARADVERVIRYGICGTSMPGHELLEDHDVASLAAFVLALRAEPESRP